MEQFHYVVPTKEHEKEAIEFINEFYQYNSPINGTGGLQRFLNDYDGWLKKLEEDRSRVSSEEKVPAETFFLVRANDNRIVGMVNIRLALNEHLRNSSGHIGYCIRPTERRKGYNKINLYLALKVCQDHEIHEVLMDCDKTNLGSAKTMQAFDGKVIREGYDNENCFVQFYSINTDQAIEKYSIIYDQYVEVETKKETKI